MYSQQMLLLGVFYPIVVLNGNRYAGDLLFLHLAV